MTHFMNFHLGGDDDEEQKEMLAASLRLSRVSRRKLLRNGDKSSEEEDPFQRVASHIIFMAASNQEKGEEKYGEDWISVNGFESGSFQFVMEAGEEGHLYMMLGIMMSIQNPELMIDLVNELGLEKECYMDLAKDQVEHLQHHQQKTNEAKEQAETELDPEDVVDEAVSHLDKEDTSKEG